MWFNLNAMTQAISCLDPIQGHTYSHIAFKHADENIPLAGVMITDHPLTCPDAPVPKPRRPDPRKRRAPIGYSMAWLVLCHAIFTDIEVLDDEGRMPCPMQLRLRGSVHLIPDMAAVCNWRPKDARSFIIKLTECGLLDTELAAAILARIGTTDLREKRQPPSKAQKAAIMAKTSGRCIYCGVALTLKSGEPTSLHADHILPVKKGATNDPSLLVPSCAKCNLAKGAKTLIEFAKERGGDAPS